MEVEPGKFRFTFDLGPFVKAMNEMARGFNRVLAAFGKAFRRPDPHHPPKLCIDGREYRRRQRRRTKSKRKR